MPDRLVYATVYWDDTSTGARYVLFAMKRLKSFFYHTAGDDGVIYPRGVDIRYNAGQEVLPGGGWEPGESAEEGALREFREETRYDLQHPQRYVPPIQTQQWTAGPKTYAGCYIKIDTRPNINAIRVAILASMNEAGTAVTRIQNGTYKTGDYRAMQSALPIIPADNELESVELLNINDPSVWATIERWQNGNRDWFYNILYYLKNNIPPAPSPPFVTQPPQPASHVL